MSVTTRQHKVREGDAASQRGVRQKLRESDLHRAVARYLGAVLPPSIPWTTLGHGGGGRVRGAMLKASGMHAGWPDVLVIGPRGRFIGLELKSTTGRLSDEQKDVHMRIEKAGALVFVCRSIDHVRSALTTAGIATRELWN